MFLVPTDFSPSAMNAAEYALQLAKYLEANLTLCNAFFLPTAIPAADYISLPQYDYETLKEENEKALEAVAKELRIKDHSLSRIDSFHPSLTCLAEQGGVVDIISKIAEKKKVSMAVMGMTGAGALSRVLLGSISRSLIDHAKFPLMLIPSDFSFRKISKIAFASTLCKEDVGVVHSIAGLARYFNADLLIAHVSADEDTAVVEHQAQSFLNEVTCKINYDRVYIRYIKASDVDQGISWLSAHGQIDMLVMVHHPRSLFERIFNGSHTHAEAEHLNVPLLVLPAGVEPVF